MKALKHGLIGWVCVLALAACAEALPSQRIQIEKAEQMLQQNAEEAIALLRSVKDPEILPDSLRARFALAMGQAHYNAHWVMNEDFLLLYAFRTIKAGCQTPAAHEQFTADLICARFMRINTVTCRNQFFSQLSN